MHTIEHTYHYLLADIADLTGLLELRGSYEGLQWCLIEAPKLEKHVLSVIEGRSVLDLSLFPQWLHRLVPKALTCPKHLRWLRQLLLFSYKSLITHDKTQTAQAVDNFIACNIAVGRSGQDLSRSSPILLDRARRHCQSVLWKLKPKAISPSHGPGASTTPKEQWLNWFEQIEHVWPCSDYMCLYFNRDHIAELGDVVTDKHIIARLQAVPKDSRGPRLICVHPAEAIWFQQGMRRELERCITLRRSSQGPWPRGRVRFDDQSANGKIALRSSLSRKYATLDLKEASDRIPDALVQVLFGRMYKYFGCCRAQKVDLKPYLTEDSVRDLHCYAPMGNATTFPVQSLVFWSICVSALQFYGFRQPGAAFVFGDDIIVPSEAYEVIISSLESFGLVVNKEKSFCHGSFRESCGVDAFNGVDVTPVRWKTTLDAENLTGMQALSDIAMRLRIAGYDGASCYVYRVLAQRLAQIRKEMGRRGRGVGLYKTNNPDHGGIAEYTPRASEAFYDAYWHPNVQWFVGPVLRLEEVKPKGKPHCGWNHVLESILSLERVGTSNVPDRRASRRVRLVRGWTPVL